MTDPRQRTGAHANDVDPSDTADSNTQPEVESTPAAPSGPFPDWTVRRAAARSFVKRADRPELEVWAMLQHDRGDTGWYAILRANHDEAMLAQRQASWAISDALDWTAQSLRPSFAQLQERRGVVPR